MCLKFLKKSVKLDYFDLKLTECAVLSLALAIGSFFSDSLKPYWAVLLGIAVIAAIKPMKLIGKQIKIKLTYFDIGLIKISVLSLGIIFGSILSIYLKQYWLVLIIVAIIFCIRPFYNWIKG
ncbi:hypothetical protein J4404_03245 [Candidatus Woesearchaeota archaeon]|nr:hypothetical protein [Candidatus Woesearchaeota archaeon]